MAASKVREKRRKKEEVSPGVGQPKESAVKDGKPQAKETHVQKPVAKSPPKSVAEGDTGQPKNLQARK